MFKHISPFQIFYIALWLILGACFLGLLVITPADAIRQARDNKQLYNIFVIGGCYFVTALIAITIYASRRWTQKTVLASIPKTWIPIEKDDVSKKVRKMIVASLTRSAAIAWDSRPRIETMPTTAAFQSDLTDPMVRLASSESNHRKEHTILHKRRTETENEEKSIAIPPEEPAWGVIAHDGWSSPVSLDLPNLQYTTVILELSHLIEAKAVSVAPQDPDSTSNPRMPDIRAVDLLQRPAFMGLRDYIGHLISLDVISNSTNASDFLSAYEYARFSSQPLTESEFRDLMKKFAELLRSMQALNPAILASLNINSVESDIDDDNSSSTTPVTPRSRSLVSSHTTSSRSESEGAIRSSPSYHLGNDGMSNSQRFPVFSTAPATPMSRRQAISRIPSSNSFAQSRVPYNGGSSNSSTSLGSSQGSVIRLNLANEQDDLPYTLHVPGAR